MTEGSVKSWKGPGLTCPSVAHGAEINAYLWRDFKEWLRKTPDIDLWLLHMSTRVHTRTSASTYIRQPAGPGLEVSPAVALRGLDSAGSFYYFLSRSHKIATNTPEFVWLFIDVWMRARELSRWLPGSELSAACI